MQIQPTDASTSRGLSRRQWLQASLIGGVALGTWALYRPSALRSEAAEPLTDVRVRRAISHAIDRQALIEAVYLRGEPTSGIGRGLAKWSLPVDQLGEGAKYYRHDPKEAKRLLAEAGFAKGFKAQINSTAGYGPDLLDTVQLVQRNLKDVGIETTMKLQEYGAYMATTFVGKFEGMAMGPISIAWEPDSVLYGLYAPEQPRNCSHVNDPKLDGNAAGAAPHSGPGSAPATHLRHPTLCGGAAVLCLYQLQHDHGILAALCEEF